MHQSQIANIKINISKLAFLEYNCTGTKIMCNLLTYWLDKNLILKYKIFDDAIFDTLFDIINKGTNLSNFNISSASQAKIKRNLISIGDKLESLISTNSFIFNNYNRRNQA